MAAALGLVAAGCGGSSDDGAADGDKPFAGQTLTVMNYQGWGSDRDYAVKTFEEATGATVKQVDISGQDEIKQILRTGGVGEIDAVEVNTSFLMQLVAADQVVPLDEDKIPNLEQIDPAFLAADGISKDGKLYGAPFIWGTTGLVYNPEKIETAPTSWAALWDPAYRGKVAFRDSAPNAVFFAAAYLGEPDPLNPSDMDAVEGALRDLVPQIATYWSSSDDFDRPYITGAVTIGNYWDTNAAILDIDGHAIEYVVPEEGVYGWLDEWAVVKDAPNPDLAHAWIDWMLSEDFQSDWANDPDGGAPASANTAVTAELTDEAKARIITYQVDPAQVHIPGPIDPETASQWQDMWERVKAGA